MPLPLSLTYQAQFPPDSAREVSTIMFSFPPNYVLIRGVGQWGLEVEVGSRSRSPALETYQRFLFFPKTLTLLWQILACSLPVGLFVLFSLFYM